MKTTLDPKRFCTKCGHFIHPDNKSIADERGIRHLRGGCQKAAQSRASNRREAAEAEGTRIYMQLKQGTRDSPNSEKEKGGAK